MNTNSPRPIQPGEKIPAYLVVSVRQLRALLRRAEEEHLQRLVPGTKPLTPMAFEHIVLDLDVDTDQRIRAIDGSYQAQLSDLTRDRYITRQWRDPALSSPDRWSKPCATSEA